MQICPCTTCMWYLWRPEVSGLLRLELCTQVLWKSSTAPAPQQFYLYMCVTVHMHAVPLEEIVRPSRHGASRWLWAVTWVLGTKFWSPSRATSTLGCWAIFPAPGGSTSLRDHWLTHEASKQLSDGTHVHLSRWYYCISIQTSTWAHFRRTACTFSCPFHCSD